MSPKFTKLEQEILDEVYTFSSKRAFKFGLNEKYVISNITKRTKYTEKQIKDKLWALNSKTFLFYKNRYGYRYWLPTKKYRNIIGATRSDIPRFIMMVGISGSGKSTKALELSKELNAIIVSPDQIRIELTGDISDQSENETVWKIAKQRVRKYLSQGRNVILDATNLDTELRRDFLKGLPKNKLLQAKVIYVRFETAKRRIEKDIKNKKNRSKVPIQILKRQYESFKGIKGRLLQEGFELI